MALNLPSGLQAWQQKLESLDPGKIELGLDRVKSVFARLNICFSGKIILVAGTNGKGSAVAALEALLLRQNASVGAYTSPHLQQFNERARYNGYVASDDDLVAAFNKVEQVRNDTPLTYFEFTTLAVMAYFAKKSPDYMIYEVGLGGRLDAVNILDADIAMITGVALDHTDWLGPNEESIGYEKAGIYRAGRPAIFAGKDIPSTVRGKIAKIGAIPYLRGDQIDCLTSGDSLLYKVQDRPDQEQWLRVSGARLPEDSILAALTAYRLLGFDLTPKTAEILSRVELPGRFQRRTFGGRPVILDVAHNPQATRYLASKLKKELPRDVRNSAIVGVMSDKPFKEMFEPLCPDISDWYLVVPEIPRAASLDAMRSALVELGVSSTQIHEVGKMSHMEPLIENMSAAVVFGSFYTVGEFLDHFGDCLE
jgi:dihydrofolate synthase/folylpolyglutamate synthase